MLRVSGGSSKHWRGTSLRHPSLYLSELLSYFGEICAESAEASSLQ